MATRVLYRHGPMAGQVVAIADDGYAATLLATGYAVVPVEEPEPVLLPAQEPATSPPVLVDPPA